MSTGLNEFREQKQEWSSSHHRGDNMRYVLRMRFANPSNNEAEYEAVLHGMRMAKFRGATCIKIHGDSNLIAQQVMKECDATCANMIAYCAMYDKLEGDFKGCEVCYLLMVPEKRLLAWSSKSLCVVNDQPVGNLKRKV
jgi:ribonuclease HI